MMKKGFSFIEILVVVTIIGVLTSLAAITYGNFLKQSRDAKRKTDLTQIAAALEMYRSNNDQYYSASFNGDCAGVTTWLSSYITTVPSDPKNSSGYYYNCIISANDYTLGAYLEGGGSGSCGNCKAGIACNYCLGPYGQE